MKFLKCAIMAAVTFCASAAFADISNITAGRLPASGWIRGQAVIIAGDSTTKMTQSTGAEPGMSVTLLTGSAVIGQVWMAQGPAVSVTLIGGSTVGLEAGVASIGTVGLDAGAASIGTLGANTGVDIGDVDVTSITAGQTIGLEAGVASVGTVGLDAGVASVGTVGLDAGVASVGTVGLDAGVASVGTVGVDAGTNYIGRVGKRRVRIAVTPTITAGAYAADDAVGGLMEFTNAVAESGTGGTIVGAIIIDDAGQSVLADLLLFDRTFTATADNAQIAISEADMNNSVGHLTYAAADYSVTNVAQPISKGRDVGGERSFVLLGTSLFAQLVTRGAPTYVATDDITVILTIEQD